MKKFLPVAFLLIALSIATACAAEDPGATNAPATLNHDDSIYFPRLDFYNMTSTETGRIILTHYPTFQQETEYSCGAAAARSVLKYFGRNAFDEPALIEALKTKPHTGTSLGNMVKFFQRLGWQVQSSLDAKPFNDEFAFQRFVAENLERGVPILVENVEWGGHWRVIIGLDTLNTAELYDDVLIFAEPYDTSDHAQDGYTFGSLDRFYWMWFDHSVLPKRERNQPWLIATPRRS